MAIDIVVVSYNTAPLLQECLTSIRETTAHRNDVRTIVADNASDDGSAELVAEKFPEVKLLRLGGNIGFGPANNRGASAGKSDLILFLNSDAILTPGALDRLEACLRDDESAIATGPRLTYPDGTFQPSCRRFPTPSRNLWQAAGLHTKWPNALHELHTWLSEAEHNKAHEVDMVSGACFLIRRTYFESIGGFDEHLFMYEEELDLFHPTRRRGLSVLYCKEATVIHHHGGSSGEKTGNDFVQFNTFFSKYFVFAKHYGRFAARVTYWSDRAIYGASACLNRLRGSDNPARHCFAQCHKAYKAVAHAKSPA